MQSVLISTNIADITTQAKCAADPSCKGFSYQTESYETHEHYKIQERWRMCYYVTSVTTYVSACTIASCAVLNYRIHCCWERRSDDGYDCWIYNPSESAILLLLGCKWFFITGIILKCPLREFHVWRLTWAHYLSCVGAKNNDATTHKGIWICIIVSMH